LTDLDFVHLLGIAAAAAVSGALLAFPPQDIARVSVTNGLDARVLVFALLVCVATGGLCGIAPALQTGRIPLIAAMRERAPSSGGNRLRRAMVIDQIALTLMLLIGSGLFLQTVLRLQEKGPGFDSERLLMFQVDASRSGYDD
jgi:hypothetical protein